MHSRMRRFEQDTTQAWTGFVVDRKDGSTPPPIADESAAPSFHLPMDRVPPTQPAAAERPSSARPYRPKSGGTYSQRAFRRPLTARRLQKRKEPVGVVTEVVKLGKDVSYRHDRPYHGMFEPVQVRSNPDAKGDKDSPVPESSLPTKYHLTRHETQFGQQHHQQRQEDTEMGQGGDAWQPVVFPSREPSSRQESIILAETYQKMKRDVGYDEAKPLFKFDKMLGVFGAIHGELVREVSVHCIERGNLMGQVWKDFVTLYQTRYREVDRIIDGRIVNGRLVCDCESDTLRMRREYQAAKDQFDKKTQEYEQNLAALRKENEALQNEISDIKHTGKVQEEEAAYTKQLMEIMSKRVELMETLLRKIDSHCELVRTDAQARDASFMSEEVRWRANETILRDYIVGTLQNASSHRAALSKLERELADMRDADELRKEAEEKARLEALANIRVKHDKSVQVALFETAVKKRNELPTVDETPPVWQRLIGNWEKGTAKVMNLRAVMRLINTLYADKIASEEADAKEHRRKQNMPEFLYNWFFNHYGVKALATKNLFELLESLVHYRFHNIRIRMFGQFAGLYDPYSNVNLSTYLQVRQAIPRSAVGPLFEECENGATYVALSRALDVAEGLFPYLTNDERSVFRIEIGDLADDGELFPKLTLAKAAAPTKENSSGAGSGAGGGGGGKNRRRRSAAMPVNSSDKRVIDNDEFLELCIQESMKECTATIPYLRKLFEASDTYTNGSLDCEEFGAVLRYIDPATTPKGALELFLESGGSADREITVQDFVTTAIRYNFQSSYKPAPKGGFSFIAQNWISSKGALEHEVKMLRTMKSRDDARDQLQRLQFWRDVFESMLSKQDDLEKTWISYHMLLSEVEVVRRWRVGELANNS